MRQKLFLKSSDPLVHQSIMGDCVSLNAWQGIPMISCGFSHIEHTSSVRDNMTEHSQVRWAILLSFTALKVSRMKSLAPFVRWRWPWLRVIKALLSFCQSSDSPNISPWLISAVSSVRAYTKSRRINTESPFTTHLSIASSKKPPQIHLHITGFLPCCLRTTTQRNHGKF